MVNSIVEQVPHRPPLVFPERYRIEGLLANSERHRTWLAPDMKAYRRRQVPVAVLSQGAPGRCWRRYDAQSLINLDSGAGTAPDDLRAAWVTSTQLEWDRGWLPGSRLSATC
jgi:hypothetical protein